MKKTTVLIVEDEAIIALNIKLMLTQKGYNIAGIASTGEKALELVKNAQPDLILMDILLASEMDGVDTALKINEQYNIPIIFQTAHSDEATLSKAMHTNPQGYILKPINPHDLYATIELALYKHEMERKLKESEDKFRTIVENAHDLIYSISKEGVFTYVSPNITEILGYNKDEIRGNNFYNYVHPDDKTLIFNLLHDVTFYGKKTGGNEYRFKHHDGSWKWFTTNISTVHDMNGSQYYTGISHNITAIKLYQVSLDEKNQELIQANEELNATIEELESANEELNATNEELEQSNEELHQTQVELLDLNNELEKSQLQYYQLFDNILSGVAIYEAINDGDDFVFIDLNRNGAKHSNVHKQDVIGKKVTEAFPGIKSFGLFDVFQRVWRTGKPELHPVTLYEDNLLSRWYENYVYKLPSGELIAVYDDVTGQKNAELALRASEEQLQNMLKEKELLLKEIHHRVKNNFQIITSLIELQLSSKLKTTEKSAMIDILSRIRTMALVHEKLLKSENFTKIQLNDFVSSLAAEISQTHNSAMLYIQTEINVKDIFITIEKAVPCGLIINELITNAYKHAFIGKSEGKITIDLEKVDDTCVLVISDNGIGISDNIDFYAAPSMGLQLINSLTEQLNGTITMDNSNGTQITLQFPHN